MTKKKQQQAITLVGLALLVWWLWPPAEVVTASTHYEGLDDAINRKT